MDLASGIKILVFVCVMGFVSAESGSDGGLGNVKIFRLGGILSDNASHTHFNETIAVSL